jgi:glycosyltransferase involved in cell wall biosynthesis
MRKVLFVHNGPLYRGPDGGVYGTHYSEAIKQRYLQLGDHVTFLMREARFTGDMARYSPIAPDRFAFVAVPDLMSPTRRIRNHRDAMQIIDREVRTADLVVARLPSLTARLAVGRARVHGKPVLAECVACNWDALWNHHWKAKLSAPWYWLAQKAVFRDLSHVIYVTEQFLQARYPTRGKQVAVSDVELPALASEVFERRLEQIAAQGMRPLRLVTTADVSVRYKGQGDVFPVLKALDARGIATEYHLIGGGDPARLRARAAALGVTKQVIFHGSTEHARVFALLDQMDIYIQPSRQEGLPRAMVEAMSRALPCTGARTGGIPELIPAGRMFAPGDTVRMQTILEQLADPDTRAQEARRNFETAQRYSAEELNARRAAFYEMFLRDNFS